MLTFSRQVNDFNADAIISQLLLLDSTDPTKASLMLFMPAAYDLYQYAEVTGSACVLVPYRTSSFLSIRLEGL